MNKISTSLLTGLLAVSPLFAAQQANWSVFGGKSAAEAPKAEQDFVHPVSSPYFNEDSFVTNDLRAWGVYHKLPRTIALQGGGAAPQGGDVQVYALQVRLALTERLQLVAYKDGYVVMDGALLNQEGWNDIGAGLKYAWYQDQKEQLFAASGIGYELGTGNDAVLQQDDELRLWSSVNKGFDKLHLGATVNLQVPMDNKAGNLSDLGGSTTLSWHLHADYRVSERFSPVAEMNGYHVLDDGRNAITDVSAIDVANLAGGKGENLVTVALGGEFRCPLTGLKLRGAYEIPLTNDNDLFKYRVTASVIWSF